MNTFPHAPAPLLVATAAVMQAAVALAADYSLSDPADALTLERSLFLCQWRTGHGAPEGEPSPVVCTTAAISTDDAVHETKQWWTYWARFDTEQAMRAKIRFNQDFEVFQARLARRPQLAQELLPPGASLPPADWGVLLVQQLRQR